MSDSPLPEPPPPGRGISRIRKARRELPAGRWAVFACGDRDYVPKLLVALASVRRHNLEVDAFVIAADFRPGDREAARRSGIEPLTYDAERFFPGGESGGSGEWHHECFWHLVCWRRIAALGYAASLSIDGDVLCCGRLPLGELSGGGWDVGCVANGSVGHHFRPARDPGCAWLQEHFHLTAGRLLRRTPNTGIMAWNHANLRRIGFSRTVTGTFRECAGKVSVASDQHLFALVNATRELSIRWLGTRWNFCRGQETGVGRFRCVPAAAHPGSFRSTLEGIHFLHLFKPWLRLSGVGGPEHSSAAEACFRKGVRRWIELAEAVYGEGWPGVLVGDGFSEARLASLLAGGSPGLAERIRGWGMRALLPALVLGAHLSREARTLAEHWKSRPPLDLSVGLLQLAIPRLRPDRLLSRSARTGSDAGAGKNPHP